MPWPVPSKLPSPPYRDRSDTLLLTLDKTARELRCALARQIARHRLTVVHVGRSVRIERSKLERFIAQMREPRDG